MDRAISQDDLDALALLAEHRVALVAQVGALLGEPPAKVGRRVHALERAGLLALEPIFTGMPAACWITRRGLRLIESRLPQPRLDLGGYRHDIGLGWLWLAARDGAFGPLAGQWSERSMRSHDRRADAAGPSVPVPSERLGISLGAVGPRGSPRRHYPDLLLETESGHRVAVELELTGKSRHRLGQIMLGYASAPGLDAVLYLCPPGPLGQRVADAARRAGVAELVHVQGLAPGSPWGAPASGRLSERRQTASRTSARPTAAQPPAARER